MANTKLAKPPPIVSSSSSCSSSSSSSSIAKIPLSDVSTSESNACKAPIVRKDQEIHKEQAPPIPPRKSTNDFSRPSKPQPVPPAPEKVESPPLREIRPPVKLAQNESFDDDEEDDIDPICGPAETISGKLK